MSTHIRASKFVPVLWMNSIAETIDEAIYKHTSGVDNNKFSSLVALMAELKSHTIVVSYITCNALDAR